MPSDITCEQLREASAELALGVLPGRERAEAIAHLDRCPDCRQFIEPLCRIGERLIGLLPDQEPPLGFETRVARRLALDLTALEGNGSARASGHAHGLGGRPVLARIGLAPAAVTLAALCGFAGWAVGTAIEDVTASAPAAPRGEPMLVGDMTSAADAGRSVGEVYAHPGRPGWIFMSVALDGSGRPYSGKVTCLLERSDGGTVRLGDFALRDGQGDWGSTTRVDSAGVSGARLVSSDGTVLATAHLQTGEMLTGTGRT
ncbi:zf-HC2 domain-containing protein [Streptomyces bungoensis]|uniref:zf-HC2 domain-containing protein n=1 Tax=Streptomyces bungoensis TaxID=285568 RepID=UPI00343929E5